MKKMTDAEHIQSLFKRYWKYVVKKDGCWWWAGAISDQGYTRIRYRRTMVGGHRVSWLIHNGNIPDGLFVLHRCDNPICTNPDHLFLGTAGDNVRDARDKGRSKNGGSAGEDNGNSKLTWAQVDEIRARPCGSWKHFEKLKDMSARMGVTVSAIKDVRMGRSWT